MILIDIFYCGKYGLVNGVKNSSYKSFDINKKHSAGTLPTRYHVWLWQERLQYQFCGNASVCLGIKVYWIPDLSNMQIAAVHVY